jgi:hypothetical protein
MVGTQRDDASADVARKIALIARTIVSWAFSFGRAASE